jgi:hypothetical protein
MDSIPPVDAWIGSCNFNGPKEMLAFLHSGDGYRVESPDGKLLENVMTSTKYRMATSSLVKRSLYFQDLSLS